jgi:NAD(P)-dependent dehydrogenase (short-subunit alcohol dehydrogenase family)
LSDNKKAQERSRELAAPDIPFSSPNLRFDGRVVWITGASRGLGRALAIGFAGAGADLVLSARSAPALNDLAEQLRGLGVRVETAIGSVTEPETLERTVATIEDAWGRLDVLVNNAGVASSFMPAAEMDEASIGQVLSTNLLAPFACCRAALALLEQSDAASIVNVTSIHGSRGQERVTDYAISKGGLEMLTRSLAVEWASRGVRVNSIAPGYLITEMTEGLRRHPRWNELVLEKIPMARFGEPAEIVGCAMFLASVASSYVTGTTLHADGGWSAK